ncbi:hypothetical protein GSI_08714 [Ganoderma sinense ZZ0214-1]|uniref:Uncharacterized protein n=1 Tax=Ganoderma sinense ZZ0214-1 TaxID=1077348 RepID=A0A2G8S4G9_9APHY|nr:hypothetical protein GSI_08714 [Ganoderma sinense ZZ0214-1]
MSPAVVRCMIDLYEALWTKQEEFTRDCCHVRVLHELLARLVHADVIVALDEYHRIWEHIVSQDPARRTGYYHMVLTGSPGIGKSFFLYYALGAALKARIPVVLYRTTRFIWICDKNGELVSPSLIFGGNGGVSVLASSPRTARWKDFAADTAADFWLAPLLTSAEISTIQLVHEELKTPIAAKWLNPPDGTAVYTPSEVSQYLGPSARVCLRKAGTPKTEDGPRHDLLMGSEPDIVFPLVRDLPQLLRGRVSSDEQYDGFHRYFFVVSPPGRSNPHNAFDVSLVVPTLFLRQTLATHLCSLAFRRRLEVVGEVIMFPQMVAALNEPLVLETLQQKEGRHTCHFVKGASFDLGPALEVCHVTLDLDPKAPPIKLKDNCIYVTPPGYPGVDAVIVSHNFTRLTLVQMTTAQKHDLNPKGIPALIDAFEQARALLGKPKWSITFIFLAPNDRAKNMAKSKANRRDLNTVGRNIKLGWLTLKSNVKTTAELLTSSQDAFETGVFPGESEGETGRAVSLEGEASGQPHKTKGKTAKGSSVRDKKDKSKAVVEAPQGRYNTRSRAQTT